MKTLLLLSSLLLLSCGKREIHTIVDNSQTASIQKELDDINLKIAEMELNSDNAQNEMEALIARIVTLETEEPVIAVLDPCPNVLSNSSYKEMLFELNNGTVIGYFENGNKRFLTEIKQGVSYQTTDDRACIFTL